MIIAILIILSVILFLSRMKWRITTLNLIYYMEQKRYKLPSKKEMEECTKFTTKNLIKDLIEH